MEGRYKPSLEGSIARAVDSLRNGMPVMIYDGDRREGEVDLVYYAGSVTWREVYTLRTLAGGLICFVTSERVGRLLGLPFAQELLLSQESLAPLASKTPGYGDPPAFSIWVNHVSVKTGISDEDRGITISGLHRVVEKAYSGLVGEARRMLREEFMSPGHVPILLARSLDRRRGHTELTVALGRLAGLPPSFVIAEMLGERWSLGLREAEAIARERRIPLLRGEEIVEACSRGEVCRGG
ncbi:3,4-dihydroxy-2-butanone 4-phosphate synthase [Aeropyrum pernix K1]|uniref:3,4-dihydroxy-2-butanone 4-phosphate synthase n=1 Tax=Aeropyrum pernix (strain ATCC 700893 / DSM 11879 / JCM 9820 / NBRC 100138 / K1) TaxID=272557 RepID=Q9YDC7_AERPE|nr:3,4-dihydroxy-2-butanone-4-phosphate synthase [Aeropyrum pernix]BAA79970.2 3,4-dihydroxy-2-butanone 4-phosphate synthase [Aeropyrum pernix K1]